jgi:hypothetical protein
MTSSRARCGLICQGVVDEPAEELVHALMPSPRQLHQRVGSIGGKEEADFHDVPGRRHATF